MAKTASGVFLDGEIAEIRVYDEIVDRFFEKFGFGISSDGFSRMLDEAIDSGASDIRVRVNSPGGNVWEGFAIYNRIRQVRQSTTVYIDGLAASIASIIALGGDRVVAGEASMVMIHNPFTFVAGDSDEMQKAADTLRKIEEQAAMVYARQTKLSRDEALTAMRETTWYTAEEAVEAGFASEIFGDDESPDPKALAVLQPKAFETFAKVPAGAWNFVKGGKPERTGSSVVDPAARRAAACAFYGAATCLRAVEGLDTEDGTTEGMDMSGTKQTQDNGTQPATTPPNPGQSTHVAPTAPDATPAPAAQQPAAMATPDPVAVALAAERTRVADIMAVADPEQKALAEKLIAEETPAIEAAKALKKDRDERSGSQTQRVQDAINRNRQADGNLPEYGANAPEDAGGDKLPEEPGPRLAAMAEVYATKHEVSYSEALVAVSKADPKLAANWEQEYTTSR